jgi:methionyl-tRNA formyltransferase
MRIIFAGSPAFAVPSLKRLLGTSHEIVAVVTQPARPAGRGLVLKEPAVKEYAAAQGLEVHQPEKFNTREFLDVLAAKAPDLIVTAAYGRIFRRRALAIPRLGCVNVHASLLPRYRGVAPINWAIIKGERETGVTAFFMDEGVDTGPVILERAIPIDEDETAGALTERLAALGADVLAEACDLIAAGRASPTAQDGGLASYAPKLAKEDGRIGWDRDARDIHNHIRGVSPWPGAFCTFRERPLKLLESHLCEDEGCCGPTGASGGGAKGENGAGGGVGGVGDGASGAGRVIRIDSGAGILVSCRREAVWLKSVQAQGKKPTGGADFARGYRIEVGNVFG